METLKQVQQKELIVKGFFFYSFLILVFRR